MYGESQSWSVGMLAVAAVLGFVGGASLGHLYAGANTNLYVATNQPVANRAMAVRAMPRNVEAVIPQTVAAASILAASEPAMAAQQVAAVADNRLALVGLILVPALGWAAFNILKPALRQLENMQKKAAGRR